MVPRRTCRRRSTRRRAYCPQSLPYPPSYNRVNPADAPIMSLAVTSDTVPIDQVADAADTLLQPKLSQIDGVGRVVVQGGLKPAIRVQLDPARLAAYGLSMEDVRTAITGGQCQRCERAVSTARTWPTRSAPTTSCVTPEAYRNLILAWRAGSGGAAQRCRPGDARGGERPCRRLV